MASVRSVGEAPCRQAGSPSTVSKPGRRRPAAFQAQAAHDLNGVFGTGKWGIQLRMQCGRCMFSIVYSSSARAFRVEVHCITVNGNISQARQTRGTATLTVC